MDKMSILAATHHMKEQLANCQCQLAVLEGLLTKEGNETPVIEESQVEQSEELPAPPAEIIIPPMLEEEEDDSPTEEDIKDSDLVKEFLKKLPGTKHIMSQIRRVEISNPSSDNGQDVPYLHKHFLQVFAFDKKGEVIYNIGNVIGKKKNGKSEFKVKPVRKNEIPHSIINAMQLRFPKLWKHRANYQSYVISVELYD